MFRVEIKKTINTKFSDGAQFDFTRQDMLRIAAKALETINKRLDMGRGINDKPMKPLSKGYAAKKKKMGQPGIRNLQFSGAMRGALTPVEVGTNRVLIGYTRRSEESKALDNQNRSPWFGLSDNDEQIVSTYAGRLLKAKIPK